MWAGQWWKLGTHENNYIQLKPTKFHATAATSVHRVYRWYFYSYRLGLQSFSSRFQHELSHWQLVDAIWWWRTAFLFWFCFYFSISSLLVIVFFVSTVLLTLRTKETHIFTWSELQVKLIWCMCFCFTRLFQVEVNNNNNNRFGFFFVCFERSKKKERKNEKVVAERRNRSERSWPIVMCVFFFDGNVILWWLKFLLLSFNESIRRARDSERHQYQSVLIENNWMTAEKSIICYAVFSLCFHFVCDWVFCLRFKFVVVVIFFVAVNICAFAVSPHISLSFSRSSSSIELKNCRSKDHFQ